MTTLLQHLADAVHECFHALGVARFGSCGELALHTFDTGDHLAIRTDSDDGFLVFVEVFFGAVVYTITRRDATSFHSGTLRCDTFFAELSCPDGSGIGNDLIDHTHGLFDRCFCTGQHTTDERRYRFLGITMEEALQLFLGDLEETESTGALFFELFPRVFSREIDICVSPRRDQRSDLFE